MASQKEYEAKLKKHLRQNTVQEQKKFSVINKIKDESRIDDKFVDQLASLSLEEVIALKLEQANRLAYGKIYGGPLYYQIAYVAQKALMKYAISCTRTAREAAAFMGIRYRMFFLLRNKFKLKSYFEEE